MKNTITLSTLLKTYGWFIFGYGQWMLFRTRAEFKAYAKNNPTIHRIKDLRSITEIEKTFSIKAFDETQAYEIIDNMPVPLAVEMTLEEASENESLKKDKPSLIEWMRDNIEHPMAFSSHDCENCWEHPGDNIIVGDSGVPFQLCDFCKGKYINSLPPDKQKRLI